MRIVKGANPLTPPVAAEPIVYTEIEVTDLEFMFPTAGPIVVTLGPHDRYVWDGGDIVVSLASGETIRYNTLHAFWVSLRKRMQRIIAPKFVPSTDPTLPFEPIMPSDHSQHPATDGPPREDL